jgi:hypothetical protein
MITRSRLIVLSAVVALVVSVGFAASASAAQLNTYGGASGSTTITGVDNSGITRHLTMYQAVCKDTTILGRLIEYKMNFGPGVSTDWKGGVSRGLNAGCTGGYRTDTFYYSNAARGVWARVCIDDPGPFNRCGVATYIAI